MQISSLNFHFESAPIFSAKRYGSSQWIEVADADGQHDHFCIFVDGLRSFDDLTRIAEVMTEAWSDGDGSQRGEA